MGFGVGTFGSGFALGTDESISVLDQQNNVLITLDGKRRMFEMKAKDTLVESDVIDSGGLVDARVVYEGYTGTIEVEKQSANFSILVKFLDANYYGGGQQNLYTIVETINLPANQGTEVNTYNNCVFHGYEPGSWQKKNITLARVQVKAQSRT